MNVLVIGQGGREHALIWKLKQSPRVRSVHCAPGNGGISNIAKIVPYGDTESKELIHYVKEQGIDLTIVGPENPLLAGLVDEFEAEGLQIYGPRKNAALIEGSKSFAKEFMHKYKIPTGSYQVFTEEQAAIAYIKDQGAPIVIKADGLAAGKGVVVAHTVQEAEAAVHDILVQNKFGEAGHKVVIEQFLEGEELSLMAFIDRETVCPMVPAQDHKPVYNGDEGPNTGGMGAYSPVPQMTEDQIQQAVDQVLIPAAKGMVAEGRPFSGILYAGLMMTAEGPQVIEFNARFGDPETQVVLPRLETDLIDIMLATLDHRLHELDIRWSSQAACSVVAASAGYPGDYEKGIVITGTNQWHGSEDVVIFHAGTSKANGQLKTSGGRVLNVTGLSADLKQARRKAYDALEKISFEGMHYRTDIADRALKRAQGT